MTHPYTLHDLYEQYYDYERDGPQVWLLPHPNCRNASCYYYDARHIYVPYANVTVVAPLCYYQRIYHAIDEINELFHLHLIEHKQVYELIGKYWKRYDGLLRDLWARPHIHVWQYDYFRLRDVVRALGPRPRVSCETCRRRSLLFRKQFLEKVLIDRRIGNRQILAYFCSKRCYRKFQRLQKEITCLRKGKQLLTQIRKLMANPEAYQSPLKASPPERNLQT